MVKNMRDMVKNMSQIRNIETEGLKAPKFIECSTCQKLTRVGTFRHESGNGGVDDIYVVYTCQCCFKITEKYLGYRGGWL